MATEAQRMANWKYRKGESREKYLCNQVRYYERKLAEERARKGKEEQAKEQPSDN